MGVNIIYQEFNLIPYMDVAQNIFLGRFPMKCGLLDITDKPAPFIIRRFPNNRLTPAVAPVSSTRPACSRR